MWCGGHIHDKSDGPVGKRLVRRQLSRSFFPACGLESKLMLAASNFIKMNGGGGGAVHHRNKQQHVCIYCSLKIKSKNKQKYTHLLQRTLDVCFGHTACARLFDDVEKRDVFLGSAEPPSEVYVHVHKYKSPNAPREEGETHGARLS